MAWLTELEEKARLRLPREVYDFVAGGADDEQTLEANTEAWRALRLHPHVLQDVSGVSTSTTFLGTELFSPIGVAPSGYQRLVHHEGETAMARGAAAAGSLMVLSSRSSTPIEHVAAAAGPWWFQVYALRDRALTYALAERARQAGAKALVLTGDAPVLGRRRLNRDSGVVPAVMMEANLGPLADPGDAEQSPSVTVDEIGRLRAETGLPVVVKGVLRADDARRCVQAGAAGIWVSNHGGRQLDGAIATADALSGVVAAVAEDAPVYVDGGLRSGRDVLRALSLGAAGAFVGRPPLWGLAAGGSRGAAQVLAALTEELSLAMALCGARDCASLTPDLLFGGPTTSGGHIS